MGLADKLKQLRDGYIERQASALPLVAGDGQPVRERIHIDGVVQNVGFRYETYLLANRLALTGWVCNNDDGSVEIEAQGPQTSIDALLDALRAVKRFRLDGIARTGLPLVPEEQMFIVLRD